VTALGAVTPSLAGTGTPYLTAQVRACDAGHCRYQTVASGQGIEVTVSASESLTAWLTTVPATGKSAAGTGAMYSPCQIRLDTDGMRVQVPGPTAVNAPFGAEYVCHGWKDDNGMIAAALTGTVAPTAPDEDANDKDDSKPA